MYVSLHIEFNNDDDVKATDDDKITSILAS